MAYSHTTFAQLKSQIADRMGERFWADAEIGDAAVESIRAWNVLTGWRRTTGSFSTSLNDPFYFLNSELSSVLGRTVKDSDLHPVAMRRLMEPPEFPHSGTGMWDQAEIRDAFQRSRDRFLAETGCVPSEDSFAVSSGTAEVDLSSEIDDSVVKVQRASWLGDDGKWVRLWEEDERSLTLASSTWDGDSENPRAFSASSAAPLALRLFPVPDADGTLHLITAKTGAALSVSSGSVLGVPDDFCWGVMWGAMGELLSKDSQSRDPERAAFCRAVWEMYAEACRNRALILRAKIGSDSLIVDGLRDLDAARPAWRDSTGTPNAMGAWHDLIALAPVPDGAHTIFLDLVGNAEVPSSDSDQIQLGREHVGPVIDWSCRLLSFKMGGAEFRAMEETGNNFIQAAMRQNHRLSASSKFAEAVKRQSTSETFGKPYELVGGMGLSSSPPSREEVESRTRERRRA